MKRLMLLSLMILSNSCTSHVYVVYVESADVKVDKQFDIDGVIETKIKDKQA